MPRCYLLTVCTGSSVDQQSNNATLFNLVEQLNVPPTSARPPVNVVPLEVHAYWRFDGRENGNDYEVRTVMLSLDSGLETPSESHTHRALSPRMRTRMQGLPLPPVAGSYELCIDWRAPGTESWTREPLRWPLNISEEAPQPRVTH